MSIRFGYLAGLAALVAILGTVAASTLRGHTREVEESSARRAEAAIFADRLRAVFELDRRLRDHVSVNGGLIVIRDRLPGLPTVYALPRSATWIVNCDALGLWVEFASGLSADGSGLDLTLTKTVLTAEQCDEIVPIVGAQLLTLTGGG